MTKATKQIAEATHKRIETLEDSVTDIAKAVGKCASKISEIHGKVSSGGSIPSKAELSPSQFEIISQIRTQLSANSALLNEALKVSSLIEIHPPPPIVNLLHESSASYHKMIKIIKESFCIIIRNYQELF